MTKARWAALLDGARERFETAMVGLEFTALWDEPRFDGLSITLRCHWNGYCERHALETNVSRTRADADMPAAVEDGVAWLVGAFAVLSRADVLQGLVEHFERTRA